jgi:isopentenyldiphosphate isomerase
MTGVSHPLPSRSALQASQKRCGEESGLEPGDEWIFLRCFQLMECDDLRLFQQWLVHWEDLAEFEIVHVVPSTEAADAALSGRDLPRMGL